MILRFEDFLNEAKETSFPVDLCFVTFKRLIKTDVNLSRVVYLSINDRENIKRQWKGRLSRQFPGPEKHVPIGRFIEPIIGEEPVYTDGSTIVFPGTWTIERDFIITDRPHGNIPRGIKWKDLAEFIIKRYKVPLFKKWIEFEGDYSEFEQENRGAFAKKKFGM